MRVTGAPWWRRPATATGLAGGLYLGVFVIRASELVDVEAADSLLAAPTALVAVAFGAYGGAFAGILAAGVFAGAEALDAGDLTWDEVVLRAVAFGGLGYFVGAAAGLLERTRARFAGAFDNAPSGILLTDAEGRIAAANRAVARLLGRDEEGLLGTPLESLSHPFDANEDGSQWRALQAGDIRGYTVERQLVGVEGHAVPVMLAVSRMPTRSDRAAFIVHVVDLSAQRRSEQQLAYLSDHDPLTGLFNRRRFDQELGRQLLHASRHGVGGAVLLLDLDHFKYVNDTLGHAAGDLVLRAVADALAERLGHDDVLARLGGDEFALLLPKVRDNEELRSASTDLLAIISGVRVTLPGEQTARVDDVHVTASIGGVLVPAFADPDRLLTAADLAMYEAKEAGRAQTRIHSPESPHAERIRAGFTWGERIRRALSERQFELHLQPIVPLSGARETHYEVLLRLNDEERLCYPAEFLPHAERLGLMVAIDRYVIENVARMLARLPRHRRPRVEVNVSAASLADENLSDWIARVLERHGVVSTNVIFEITETVAISNMQLAAATIGRLRARGSLFALDDFGVGVSSFYYLRELPFDILKIDGEFVRDLATNRANQTIVRSMIETAHGLGKTTIAEYVDSFTVADILQRLGCDFAQGHFFGSARPAAEVLEF
jgi:diguanylate cyclase (GGDEF)-like protein/PAS domain S-box-containing protein